MLALVLYLTLAPCLASEDRSAQVSEHQRLHVELERLAAKQAWSGVERTWRDLLATGVDPEDGDRITAAQGALALGDLSAARERLLPVATRTEDRDVIETLYRIDHDYGRVRLVGSTELVIEERPFLPEAAAAVAFAAQRVAEEGRFEGHLPPGRYRYGMEIIEVVPGEAVELDLSEPARRRRRRPVRTW